MARKKPNYPELHALYGHALMVIEALSTDPEYKITTKPAIRFALKDLAKLDHHPTHAVLVIIEYIAALRKINGFDGLNAKISRAIHTKHRSIILRARWSKTKLIVLLNDDPEDYIPLLRIAFKNKEIPVWISSARFSLDVENTIRTLEAIDQAHKEGYLV